MKSINWYHICVALLICSTFSISATGENATATTTISQPRSNTTLPANTNTTTSYTNATAADDNVTIATGNLTEASTPAPLNVTNDNSTDEISATTILYNSTSDENTTETASNSTTAVNTTVAVTTSEPLSTPVLTTVLTNVENSTLSATTVEATTPAVTEPTTLDPSTTEKPTTLAETTLAPTTEEITTAKLTTTPNAETTNTQLLKCQEITEKVAVIEIYNDVKCTSYNNNTKSTAAVGAKENVTFPATLPGVFAKTTELCKACENVNQSIGFRICNGSAVWQDPVYLNCTLGVESITDPGEQSSTLLALTATNDIEVDKAISIIQQLSAASSINETVALTLLDVTDNVLQSTEFTSGDNSNKDILRNSLEKLASSLKETQSVSLSKFALAFLKQTLNQQGRRKRATDCNVLLSGTNTSIQKDMSLVNTVLKSGEDNYLNYGSAEICGDSALVVMAFSDESFFSSGDDGNNVKSPILFVGSSLSSFSGQTIAKLKLYSRIKDDETKGNDTHNITTSYNASCALWESNWSEGKCTVTALTAEHVQCTCNIPGYITVLEVFEVTYIEKEQNKSGLSTGALVGIIVGSIIGFIILLALIAYICKVKNKNGRKVKPDAGAYEMVDSRNVSPSGRPPLQ